MTDLLVGVEVHRMISYHKLLCRCRYLPADRKDLERFQTRLFDKKAVFYGSPGQVCSYQRDDVPARLNAAIVRNAGRILSRFEGIRPVRKLLFSRKQILDGSIPTGYQVTGLLATGGVIRLSSGKSVPISTITLQTDSATPFTEESYLANRVGVPLLEVTTQPSILSPAQVIELLKAIQLAINPHGFLPRGVNVIRQDLNVSWPSHPARIELKGVDSLSTIPAILDRLVQRMSHEAERLTTTRRVTSNNDTEFMRYPLGSLRMRRQTELPLVQLKIPRNRAVRSPLDQFTGRIRRPRFRRVLLRLLRLNGYYSFDCPVLEACLGRPRLYEDYLRGSVSAECIIRGLPAQESAPSESELRQQYHRLGVRDFYRRYRRCVTRSFKIWEQNHK